MSKPLHLLVVEDSEAEVAPLVRELRRNGYEPEAVRVDAAAAMRDALQRQAWDVVIADHGLPGFSRHDALRILQESGLDVPFIIVSETLGRAAAATAMKAGAHDYVMKDHLTRLGPAVERELQEASVRRQRREAEQSLAAHHEVTRILAEADTLGEAGAKILQAIAKNGEWEAGEIWTVDRQSDVLRCLETWHAAGKPLGEFATRTRALTFARGVGLPGRVWASGQPAWIADVTQDANFPRAPLAAEAGLRGAIGFPIGLPMVVGREVMGVIAFFRTTPGQPDEKLLAVLNAVGNQIGQFLVRQQAEEELKKLSIAVQQTANCVLITDRKGVIEYVNPAFERTTGYAREEVIGKTPRLLKSGQHDQKYYETLWSTLLAGETFFAEFVNRKKSGELYHTEQTITPLRDTHGHITHFVSTGRDITERARAEEVLRASEKRFQGLFESSRDAIMTLEPPSWRFTAGNPATVKMFGAKSKEEFISHEPWELSPDRQPDGRASAEKAREMIETAVREGSHFFDWTHRRIGGEEFHADVLLTRMEQGGKVILQATVRDITERKRAEGAVTESQGKLTAIFDAAADGILLAEIETRRFLAANASICRMLGYSQEELLNLGVSDIYAKEDLAEAVREFERHAEGNAFFATDMRVKKKDGSVFFVDIHSARVTLGGKVCLVGIFRDITERRRAEEALKLFRALVDQSHDTIEVVDPETGRFLDVNEKGHLALGYSREEFLALSIFDVDPTVDQSAFPRAVEELRKSGVLMWEGSHRRKDGSTFPVEVSIKYVQLDRDYAVAVVRDITEHKRTAETLRASEARYRILAESAQDIIYVINREFRVEYINEYGAKRFGHSVQEMAGRHLTELFPPETTQWQLADMARVFRTGEPLHRERQLPFGQQPMWLDTRLVPVKNATGEVESILGISRDITERKQVEGQRLRTQRLESIGTLAGGVAHDLNNALAPILMAAELLRLEFPDTATRYLELIQGGAKRGADMVKQLLTFAKGVEGERLLLQPRHFLKEIEKLIGGTFPKNIELRTSFPKDLRTILGDATQLHQVLLNLCVNARDAMPNGGTLTLNAENVEIDAAYARAVPEAKPGHYVVWRVMDTGTGIPPEILDRIFEPFFTTKAPDKGTGLGLSTVIGIVKSHGGFVRVYSVPGQGSTFAVYLPAYGADAGDISLLTKVETTFRGHGETILVVDDEAAIRNVLRDVLTKLNFKVLTASDGTAALVQVAEKEAELRGVITDLHMPHMDGLSFVRVLKSRLPQAGVIVVSGRLDEREANEFKKLGIHAVLDKPFTQEKLVEALQTIFQKEVQP